MQNYLARQGLPPRDGAPIRRGCPGGRIRAEKVAGIFVWRSVLFIVGVQHEDKAIILIREAQNEQKPKI